MVFIVLVLSFSCLHDLDGVGNLLLFEQTHIFIFSSLLVFELCFLKLGHLFEPFKCGLDTYLLDRGFFNSFMYLHDLLCVYRCRMCSFVSESCGCHHSNQFGVLFNLAIENLHLFTELLLLLQH